LPLWWGLARSGWLLLGWLALGLGHRWRRLALRQTLVLGWRLACRGLLALVRLLRWRRLALRRLLPRRLAL